MSYDQNQWNGIGRVTKDVEMKYTPDGMAVCNFNIAVGRGKDAAKTLFLGIVAFKKTAEICGEYLKKGKQIAVTGHLQQRSWETPEGQKRSVIECVASQVMMLADAGQKASNQPEEIPPPNDAPIDDSDIPF